MDLPESGLLYTGCCLHLEANIRVRKCTEQLDTDIRLLSVGSWNKHHSGETYSMVEYRHFVLLDGSLDRLLDRVDKFV